MKLAICDDNPSDLSLLLQLLTDYDPKLEVDAFASALELYQSAAEQEYEAVILDIEMEAPNGYDIALQLAREDSHPVILFLTNSAAYAVRGYGLAFRYLLKPLTQEALAEAMDALAQELRSNRLIINLEKSTQVVRVQDIIYAEVHEHHVFLNTLQGRLGYRSSLKDLAAQLPERWFAIPHQSYLVNLLHVCSVVEQEVRLTNGVCLPISRRKLTKFMHSFYRFLGV